MPLAKGGVRSVLEKANSFEEVTLSRHGGGETPPFHGYAVRGSVGFVATCHCSLSVASDGEAAWEGSAPYWVRHGVNTWWLQASVRKPSGNDKLLMMNDELPSITNNLMVDGGHS